MNGRTGPLRPLPAALAALAPAALLAAWLGAAAVPVTQAAEPAAFAARLVAADRTPVEGARAVLAPRLTPYEAHRRALAGEPAPEPLARAASSPDGVLRIGPPPSRPAVLEITAPGFAPDAVPMPAGTRSRDAPEMPLPTDRGLEVTVEGSDGEPVAGARVVAAVERRLSGTSRRRKLPGHRSARTGDDGTARLPLADGEVLLLWAVPPDLQGARIALSPPVRVAAEDVPSPLRLRLPAAVPRRLRAVRPDGTPVAGAVVALSDGGPAVALTDAAGEAVVPVPSGGEAISLRLLAADRSAGRVTLSARPDGRPPGDGDASGTPPAVAVELAPPVEIAGRALSTVEREPVPDALVWWSGEPTYSARSDGRGSFTLVVPADRLGSPSAVLASARGFHGAHVRLPAGAPAARLEVALEPMASLAGRVVDGEGRGLHPADVWVRAGIGPHGLAGRRELGSAGTRPDGAFRVRALNAGVPLQLRVEADGFAPAERTLEPLRPGERRSDLVIQLAPGVTARGRVTGPAGEPLPGARVVLVAQETLDHPEDRTWIPCDAEGVFVAPRLAPGTYDLRAVAPGHAPGTRRGVEVPQRPQPVDVGTLHLEREAPVSGRVTHGGEGVAGARVVVDVHEPDPLPTNRPRRVRTDGDGRFHVDGLAEGRRLGLRVESPGFVPRTVSGVAAPRTGLEVELNRGARVSGRVVDGAGEPLGGVSVSARSSGPPVGGDARYRATVSDGDGRFELDGVPPGALELRTSSVSLASPPATRVEVREGEHREGIVLVVERDRHRVHGRVVGTGGEPLGDAVVSLTLEGEGGVTLLSSQTRTRDDGSFELEVESGGTATLAADHPEYRRTASIFELEAGDRAVELVLEPGGAPVSGRVVDEEGRGVSARLVFHAEDATGDPAPALGAETRSAADGSFRTPSLEPGRYRLVVGRPGWAAQLHDEAIEVGDVPVTGVEVRLRPGATVRGRVLGLDDADLPRVTVDAQLLVPRLREPAQASARTRPDHTGSYRLRGLRPGRWQVQGWFEDRTADREVVVTEATSGVEADLDFAGGFTLTGTVRVNGEPLPDAQVWLARSGRRPHRTRTDPAGGFRFSHVAPGTYGLTVGRASVQREVEVASDRHLDLDLRTGTVAGQVVDAEGQPVRGAAVVLVGPEGRHHGMASDGDGWFRIRVPSGSHRLHADAEGYARTETRVSVPPGGAVEGIELVLTRGAAVVLELVPGALPVPDHVLVMPYGGPARPVAHRPTPVGDGGRVEVTGLPPGASTLLVGAEGRGTVAVPVEVPGKARVTLPPEARLRVEVPEIAERLQNGWIRLRHPDGRPLLTVEPWGAPASTWSLPGGRGEVGALPAGPVRVHVESRDGLRGEATVHLVAGETRSVVVHASRAGGGGE